MTACPENRRVLEQHAGGRVRPGAEAAVRDHIAGCGECRRAVADYAYVVDQARAAFPAKLALNDFVRTRVARNAASDALRAPWWRRLAVLPQTPAWGAVAPALMVALVVSVPLALRRAPAPIAQGEGPTRIEMQANGGAVSLAWSDGDGKAYKVYKSSDPRRLGQGRPEIVKGNQWVDENPESSQVVFYRVE